MRSYKIESIILKRRNTGEADRIVTIFTKKQGKMHIKAVGVRRVTSRRSPHIEPLNRSILTLYKGGGMPVLIEAQTIEHFSVIKNDLTRDGFAYHLCELIDGLCPEGAENQQVFTMFYQTLLRLCLNPSNILSVVREFEASLLIMLGYWPVHKPLANLDTKYMLENILERKLKANKIFSSLL